jgi:hypothetical protein
MATNLVFKYNFRIAIQLNADLIASNSRVLSLDTIYLVIASWSVKENVVFILLHPRELPLRRPFIQ